jgi:tetratricopeptide (TPR) repeat protein
MFTDRYGLALSTESEAANSAYNEAYDLLLTVYPGAVSAYDRAILADPRFAAAYIGKARAQQVGGDMPSAVRTLATAEGLSELKDGDRSRVNIFGLIFTGQNDAAFTAVREHLKAWPRDALVLSTNTNQLGLIGLSGRAGREQELVEFLRDQAEQYGDDWWFNSHYAMALSEVGQQASARPKIERSMAQYPRNAYGAHALVHAYYETNEPDSAISFLHTWLPEYGPTGVLYGHLSWHLSLLELQRGNVSEGLRLYREAFASDDYQGPAILKLLDAASFLWRVELAGYPVDDSRWRALAELAHRAFPKAGMPFADWHIALADAATGDQAEMERRIAEMEALVSVKRYPAAPTVPALARAFAAFRQQDFLMAIKEIEPVLPERARICGSRAQVDLIEATLLKAYLGAGRLDDVRRLLRERRPGPAQLPVAGVELLH